MGDLVRRELGELVDRVERGESGAAGELRRFLQKSEHAAVVLDRMLPGALEQWIERRAGGNEAAAVVVERQVSALRRALLSREATALEQLLVDRVLVTWVALEHCESVYLRGSAGEHTPRQADAWLRRVDGAHRRHLAALRSLAQWGRPALTLQVAGRLE